MNRDHLEREITELHVQVSRLHHQMRRIESILLGKFHPKRILITQGDFMPTQGSLTGGAPGTQVGITLVCVDQNGNAGPFLQAPSVSSSDSNVTVSVAASPNSDGSYAATVTIASAATTADQDTLTASAGSISSNAVPFPITAPVFNPASIVITQP